MCTYEIASAYGFDDVHVLIALSLATKCDACESGQIQHLLTMSLATKRVSTSWAVYQVIYISTVLWIQGQTCSSRKYVVTLLQYTSLVNAEI